MWYVDSVDFLVGKKGADLTTFEQHKKGTDLTKKDADLTTSHWFPPNQSEQSLFAAFILP